jgi:hypothetical protein
VIVWLALAARADPGTELVRQRALVDQAASAVASARAEGHRRELGGLMAAYRVAAAELERMQQLAGYPAEDLALARREAVDSLRLAWAEGQRDDSAREVLVRWLGEPSPRQELLRQAVEMSRRAPDSIRRGILLDVLEQTDALAVLLASDTSLEEASADQLQLRASSLRRRGPGQTATMADEVEAVRATEQAAAALARAGALQAQRQQVLELRRQAVLALEEEG